MIALNGAVAFETFSLASLVIFLSFLSYAILWTALNFLLFSNFLTTSLYFQPTSCERRPTWQYLRPGLKQNTLRAAGTTTRLRLSYGGGHPSYARNLRRALFPRSVLCGIMPRTVFHNILDGALKWNGPRAGFTLHRLRRNDINFNLFLKKLPDMFSCSHLTTTTLLPSSKTFAMTAAKRPNK